jgi:hypothetical protein
VEPAHGRQGVSAALAAEQVSRRLRACLRAGDFALSVSRRRQRAQGQDQKRRDQLQRGEQPIQLGGPLRRRPRDDHILDKQFLPKWRQSKFPGGCAHACELETSLYLYLDGDNVRKDKIKNGDISFNLENNPFNYVDLYGTGPATIISWTSSYTETGVLGEPELASAEKGRQVYDEAVKQLARFITYFKDRPKDIRKDRHRQAPTMPFPWGQVSLKR